MIRLLVILFLLATNLVAAWSGNWYVDQSATGTSLNYGTNWANCWTNLASVNSHWLSIHAGDTLWLGGGPQGGTVDYKNWLSQYNQSVNDGTEANPIWIRFDGTNTAHNGSIVMWGGWIKSRYLKVDCARDGVMGTNVNDPRRWRPKNVLENYYIPTNIAVTCNGTNAGVDMWVFYYGTGNDLYWVASKDQFVRMDQGHIVLNQNEAVGSNEVAYCYMTNFFDYVFNGSGVPGPSEAFGRLNIHHCLFLEGQDNLIQNNNSMDFHDNIFISSRKYQRDSDGWQTGGNYFRIWNNILSGCTTRWISSVPTSAPNGNATLGEWYIFNNIFFGRYEHTWAGSTPGIGGGNPNQSCHVGQFMGPEMSPSGVSGVTTNCYLTNWWICNNIFHDEFSGSVFWWNSYVGTGANAQPSGQAVYAEAEDTYFFNNVIVAPTNYVTPLVAFQYFTDPAVSGGYGYYFQTNRTQFDYNTIFSHHPNTNCWNVSYSTNAYNITRFPGSWGFGSGNRTNIISFVNDVIVSRPSYLYVPSWSSTGTQFGTNLASSRIGQFAPWITNDILGRPRSSGAWNMGPYELQTSLQLYPAQDTNLLLWLSFNAWDGVSTNIVDDSGNGNNAHIYGLWVTNTPTLTNGPMGWGNAAHFWGNGASSGEFPYRGAWMAVHPVNTNLYYLTNATVSIWAAPEPVSSVEVGNSSVLLDAFYLDSGGANSWRLGRYYSFATRLTMQGNSPSTDDTNRFGFLSWPDYDPADAGEHVYSMVTNWHHYAFTFDGTNIAGYYDGTNFATTNVTGVVTKLHLNTKADWLAIGAWQHQGTAPQEDVAVDNMPNTGWWNGGMDDIRIYNRALSASEIADLYARPSVQVFGAFGTGDGALAQLATPTISSPSNSVPTTATITCSTVGSIYWTTNGTTPTTNSTLYTYGTPLTISAACTLKAFAALAPQTVGDLVSSAVISYDYGGGGGSTNTITGTLNVLQSIRAGGVRQN